MFFQNPVLHACEMFDLLYWTFHFPLSVTATLAILCNIGVSIISQQIVPAHTSVSLDSRLSCFGSLCWVWFIFWGKALFIWQLNHCKAEDFDDVRVRAQATRVVRSASFCTWICSSSGIWITSLTNYLHFWVYQFWSECLSREKIFLFSLFQNLVYFGVAAMY